ncbi:unnamed protein product [Caenorhabditis sp. 36 PRJEB53466]|nr:unnamed protein product [Caenorhabditis sp. 36 PRJEB53466]
MSRRVPWSIQERSSSGKAPLWSRRVPWSIQKRSSSGKAPLWSRRGSVVDSEAVEFRKGSVVERLRCGLAGVPWSIQERSSSGKAPLWSRRGSVVDSGAVEFRKGSVVVSQGSVVDSGAVEFRKGSVVVSQGSVVDSEAVEFRKGSVVVSQGSVVDSEAVEFRKGSVVVSQGSVVDSEAVEFRKGSVVVSQGFRGRFRSGRVQERLRCGLAGVPWSIQERSSSGKAPLWSRRVPWSIQERSSSGKAPLWSRRGSVVDSGAVEFRKGSVVVSQGFRGRFRSGRVQERLRCGLAGVPWSIQERSSSGKAPLWSRRGSVVDSGAVEFRKGSVVVSQGFRGRFRSGRVQERLRCGLAGVPWSIQERSSSGKAPLWSRRGSVVDSGAVEFRKGSVVVSQGSVVDSGAVEFRKGSVVVSQGSVVDSGAVEFRKGSVVVSQGFRGRFRSGRVQERLRCGLAGVPWSIQERSSSGKAPLWSRRVPWSIQERSSSGKAPLWSRRGSVVDSGAVEFRKGSVVVSQGSVVDSGAVEFRKGSVVVSQGFRGRFRSGRVQERLRCGLAGVPWSIQERSSSGKAPLWSRRGSVVDSGAVEFRKGSVVVSQGFRGRFRSGRVQERLRCGLAGVPWSIQERSSSGKAPLWSRRGSVVDSGAVEFRKGSVVVSQGFRGRFRSGRVQERLRCGLAGFRGRFRSGRVQERLRCGLAGVPWSIQERSSSGKAPLWSRRVPWSIQERSSSGKAPLWSRRGSVVDSGAVEFRKGSVVVSQGFRGRFRSGRVQERLRCGLAGVPWSIQERSSSGKAPLWSRRGSVVDSGAVEFRKGSVVVSQGFRGRFRSGRVQERLRCGLAGVPWSIQERSSSGKAPLWSRRGSVVDSGAVEFRKGSVVVSQGFRGRFRSGRVQERLRCGLAGVPWSIQERSSSGKAPLWSRRGSVVDSGAVEFRKGSVVVSQGFRGRFRSGRVQERLRCGLAGFRGRFRSGRVQERLRCGLAGVPWSIQERSSSGKAPLWSRRGSVVDSGAVEFRKGSVVVSQGFRGRFRSGRVQERLRCGLAGVPWSIQERSSSGKAPLWSRRGSVVDSGAVEFRKGSVVVSQGFRGRFRSGRVQERLRCGLAGVPWSIQERSSSGKAPLWSRRGSVVDSGAVEFRKGSVVVSQGFRGRFRSGRVQERLRCGLAGFRGRFRSGRVQERLRCGLAGVPWSIQERSSSGKAPLWSRRGSVVDSGAVEFRKGSVVVSQGSVVDSGAVEFRKGSVVVSQGFRGRFRSGRVQERLRCGLAGVPWSIQERSSSGKAPLWSRRGSVVDSGAVEFRKGSVVVSQGFRGRFRSGRVQERLRCGLAGVPWSIQERSSSGKAPLWSRRVPWSIQERSSSGKAPLWSRRVPWSIQERSSSGKAPLWSRRVPWSIQERSSSGKAPLWSRRVPWSIQERSSSGKAPLWSRRVPWSIQERSSSGKAPLWSRRVPWSIQERSSSGKAPLWSRRVPWSIQERSSSGKAPLWSRRGSVVDSGAVEFRKGSVVVSQGFRGRFRSGRVQERLRCGLAGVPWSIQERSSSGKAPLWSRRVPWSIQERSSSGKAPLWSRRGSVVDSGAVEFRKGSVVVSQGFRGRFRSGRVQERLRCGLAGVPWSIQERSSSGKAPLWSRRGSVVDSGAVEFRKGSVVVSQGFRGRFRSGRVQERLRCGLAGVPWSIQERSSSGKAPLWSRRGSVVDSGAVEFRKGSVVVSQGFRGRFRSGRVQERLRCGLAGVPWSIQERSSSGKAPLWSRRVPWSIQERSSSGKAPLWSRRGSVVDSGAVEFRKGSVVVSQGFRGRFRSGRVQERLRCGLAGVPWSIQERSSSGKAPLWSRRGSVVDSGAVEFRKGSVVVSQGFRGRFRSGRVQERLRCGLAGVPWSIQERSSSGKGSVVVSQGFRGRFRSGRVQERLRCGLAGVPWSIQERSSSGKAPLWSRRGSVVDSGAVEFRKGSVVVSQGFRGRFRSGRVQERLRCGLAGVPWSIQERSSSGKAPLWSRRGSVVDSGAVEFRKGSVVVSQGFRGRFRSGRVQERLRCGLAGVPWSIQERSSSGKAPLWSRRGSVVDSGAVEFRKGSVVVSQGFRCRFRSGRVQERLRCGLAGVPLSIQERSSSGKAPLWSRRGSVVDSGAVEFRKGSVVVSQGSVVDSGAVEFRKGSVVVSQGSVVDSGAVEFRKGSVVVSPS